MDDLFEENLAMLSQESDDLFESWPDEDEHYCRENSETWWSFVTEQASWK